MKAVPLTALCTLALWTGVAGADIISIDWEPDGNFAKELSVAPGKFAEVCGKLPVNTVVRWSFEADARMDFNVHFHESKTQVVFPARLDGSSQANGTLKAAVRQDYCWMWTNPSAGEVKLKFALKRDSGA